MKKIFALLVFLGMMILSFAQMPGFQRNGGQMPTGRFYGKIVDAANKGIEAVSVVLVTNQLDSVTKKPKEVVAGGMLTTAAGDFSIENVPLMGRYKLRISGIGYKKIEKPVAFDLPNRNAMSNAGNDPSAFIGLLDKDLGNIKLEIDNQVLSNITVTASKPLLQLGIDRKIFNVDKNIVSAGGTAVDVMRNVPSLNVDIDGNVTLRNTTPTIFVDGRPTNLTLDQIPADAIESVEVITNPSAKFDASGGTAGILNIVMKKNKRVGYSGNVRANLDSRAKFGFGGDINVRQKKINVFANAMFNQRKSISNGTTSRTTTLGNTNYYTTQNDRSVQNFNFGFARGGFDYFIDNRNTLTLNGTFVKGQGKPTTNSVIDSITNSVFTKEDYRISNSTFNFRNYGSQLAYTHNFPKSGHQLTADATYNKGNNDNFNLITNSDYFMPQNTFNKANATRQNITGTNENLIIQTDYANPINENTKFEVGARAAMRKTNSSNFYYYDSTNRGSFYPTTSTVYNSLDNVYAAYATYSSQIKKWGYQLGLRAESSSYRGELPGATTKVFTTNFPISLFPSVFLTDKISENDQLQLNYNRRINRPNFWQLFPFVDSSDIFNVSQGNPALKPEFTNSFEMTYSKTFKNRDNFLATLYYKRTNNLITRYYDTTFSKKYIVNTFINANSSYVTGLELISKNKITKWWDLTSNLNLFTAKINITGQTNPQFPSYFAKLNNSFKLPKNFSFQLSGDYTSKIITSPGGSAGGGGRGGGMFGGGGATASQGYIRPNYGVDAAIRFEFLKNKTASLSLNVNDIFKTRRYNAHSASGFFVQDIYRVRDQQVFRLNFNFRFGKFDAALFKRKNTNADSNIDMGNVNQ